MAFSQKKIIITSINNERKTEGEKETKTKGERERKNKKKNI